MTDEHVVYPMLQPAQRRLLGLLRRRGCQEERVPLAVSWLSLSLVYSSKLLGVCSLPGCRFKDVRRNLQKDISESSDQCISASHFHGMDELKNYGTQDIFVLCTRGELPEYRVPNLIDTYRQHGICVHHCPVLDGDTDVAECCKILEELRSCLESNQKTVVQQVLVGF